MTAPALTRRRRAGAMLLTLCAGAAFWAGWGLGLVPHTALNAVIGVMPMAALIFLLFAQIGDVFCRFSAVLLAVFPIAALASFIWAGGAPLTFAAFENWPMILLACGSMFALSAIGQSAIAPLFAQAAFIFAVALTLAHTAGFDAQIARWAYATPIHASICLMGLVAICAILAAASSANQSVQLRPFIGGALQLLPLLGFAGTIWGIMGALTALPQIFGDGPPDPAALQAMLSGLGSAFETTLLGVGAAILGSFLVLIMLDHTKT